MYVTSGFTDEVWILDARDGRELGKRSVDLRAQETDEPHGIAVDPDAVHWYVTVSHGSPTLWKYETSGDRLVGRLELESRGASRVRVSPDGELAFVPDYVRDGSTGDVVVVRLQDLTVLARTPTCAAPHDAEPSPDGSVVAVACALGDEVVLLDGQTFAVTHRFPVASETEASTRQRPMNVAWSDDGSLLYVTNMASHRVNAFDLDGVVRSSVEIGDSPAQIDGHRGMLVTANRGDATVSVLSTTPTLHEVRRVRLEGIAHPHGITLDPSGQVAFVTYEGTIDTHGGVVALDVPTGRELWRARFGGYVLGVGWGPP